ncbi:MAG: class I SAM-dependent methyltransferase [Alphaproteobacteria bacterium]|nr:class I SAM-dependent methyltransferase [Alphaproteobacteria bacterium]
MITATLPPPRLQDSLQQLCRPEFDPFFWPSARRAVLSAWYGHVPFAHWLVTTARPRVIVELGTHNGVSYAAFCEAALRAQLEVRCFAADTWLGDEQAGHFDESVYREFREFHDPRYGEFSTLVRSRFDDAVSTFADGTVDLLHIDGIHTYDAARHDFETWLPKLSERGVVLFHDIAEHKPGFGVAQLWAELERRYPSFAFFHCHGLGVLAAGPDVAPAAAALCALPEAEAATVRARFERLGESEPLRCALTVMTAQQQPPPAPSGLRAQDSGADPALSRSVLRLRSAVPAGPALKLGIGVATCNRSASLARTLSFVLSHTRHAYELLIADDGSTDGTREALRSFAGTGIGYLHSANMGVNWNKNRLLFMLHEIRKCDVVILLEDDSFPAAECWEANWIAGALRWGHVNNAGEWFAQTFMDGAGTVEQPYRCANVSAQCAAFSREALACVGFFDPELGNFGSAHWDHSLRMIRAGYGGELRRDGALETPLFYLISGNIMVSDEPSGYPVYNPADWERFWSRLGQPVHRMPWRNDAEREQLWAELAAVQIL